MKKIYISNACNDSNKGDLAIVESTITVLKKIYPGVKFVIQNTDYSIRDIKKFEINRWSKKFANEYYGSFFPRVFPERKSQIVAFLDAWENGLLALLLLFNAAVARYIRYKDLFVPNRYKGAWRALLNSDIIIIKGGSYLHIYRGLKYFVYLFRMLLTPSIATLLGKKVIYLGHSIGPVTGKLHRYFLKAVLQKAEAIFVREKLTLEYVKENLNISGPFIELLPDLAFINNNYVLPEGNILNDILQKEGIQIKNQNKYLIGLTVIDWNFPSQDNPLILREKYIRAVVEIINFLRKEFNTAIFFIPQCMKDISFASEIYKAVKDKSNIYLLRGDYRVEELRTLFRVLTFVIGTRCHSNILALSVGTPVIPIAYEIHKGFGIMEMAGIAKNSIFDISNIDTTRLKVKIRSLLKESTNIQSRKFLYNRITSLQAEIKKKIEKYLTHISDA